MCRNLRELLLNSVARHGDEVALRYKQKTEWQTLTYRDLAGRVREVTEVVHDLGLKPDQRVAIHLDNCPQWFEIYFGIVSGGWTAVPIDAKLREQEVAHILRHSGAQAVFSSIKGYALLREIAETLPDLETVILLDEGAEQKETGVRIRLKNYDTARARVAERAAGEDAWFDRAMLREDNIASIIYTSGTTGRQKGAMLSHANFVANVESCQRAIDILPSDHFLLALPLHHVFAFMANLLLPISVGAEVSLVESLKTVGENIREVSPTVVCGVPLLLEKMHGRIWKGLRANRTAYFLYRIGLRGPVRRGIKQKLGGKLRMIISGGAPCPEEVLRGFSSLGIPVLEGYGLTETAPVLTFNPPDAPRPGTVGKPLPDVEIRIVSPNAEGIGEIAARGRNVMKGYLNDPAATREIMDGEWLHTGDLGFVDDGGYVTITGRKKSLIVNREGKNIYPEEVEARLNASPLILESLVLGYTEGSEKGERVGVILVPDLDALDARSGDKLEQRGSEDINRVMRDEVRRVSQDLAEYKRPRRIQVRMEEFEKTSTQKIKRYLYELPPQDLHP